MHLHLHLHLHNCAHTIYYVIQCGWRQVHIVVGALQVKEYLSCVKCVKCVKCVNPNEGLSLIGGSTFHPTLLGNAVVPLEF